MKFISVTTILILFLFACKKKDEVVDKCTNGFKDIGETGIDCGGNCGPCPTTYIPTVQCSYNGIPTSFHTKNLSFSSNSYGLNFSNDSLYIQLNLGSNGAVGTYPILANGSLITKSGTSQNFNYSNITNATVSISSHNTSTHRMSGLFTVDFYQAGSGADTVRITSGSFEDLLY